jgi:hypothetical protein
MRIKFNSDIQLEKWKQFSSENQFASPFQTPGYYNLYNSFNHLSADVIAVENTEGEIKALVVITIQKEKGVKGYFSKRGIIYGGPLLTDLDSSKHLIDSITKRYQKKLIYLEIRNFFDFNKYESIFNAWTFSEHLNVQLNIEGISDLESYLKLLKYNRRREIKQSLKNDAIYNECKTKEDLEIIYKILQELYHERVKLPLPTFDFFEKMLNNVNFIIFKVEHENKIIGGAICTYLDKKKIYTLFYCGLRNYDKKIFPTHLAVLATIDFGLRTNLSEVDFMGAGKPNKEYGVRDYKLKFGGNLVNHGRYILVLDKKRYKLGEFGIKMLAKIKK